MSGWRLIVDRGSYADFSISVSPAVEKAVARGESPPTVFLTVFDSDSITIGVNEDPEQVLDLAFCRAHGISFRRRVNGGGPIYAGADSCFLVYFLPLTHEAVPRTTAEAFPRLLGALAETFAERYRFPAEYRPLNDIQVEGRKLVPASLKIENGVMTLRLVINVKPIDTELAGRAMPMAPEKVRDKPLKDLTSRFTWLEREAGRTIDAGELAEFSIAATARAFGETGLVRGALSERERGYAASFRAELATEDWLHGKSERTRLAGLLQPGDTIGRGREKAVGGMIRATLAVGAGRGAHGDRQRRLAPAADRVRRLAGRRAERCRGRARPPARRGRGVPRARRGRVRRRRGRRSDGGAPQGSRRPAPRPRRPPPPR